MHNVTRLLTHDAQCRDGITSFEAVETAADGEGATATVVLLEGVRVVLRLDLGGIRAESATEGSTQKTVYDSVNSFLLNNSAGFKAHFNSSLFAALSKVAAEREAEEEAEASSAPSRLDCER